MLIQITHHNWRTDPTAVAQPWGVQVNNVIVSRHDSAGVAGRHAQAIADTNGADVDWNIVQVGF